VQKQEGGGPTGRTRRLGVSLRATISNREKNRFSVTEGGRGKPSGKTGGEGRADGFWKKMGLSHVFTMEGEGKGSLIAARSGRKRVNSAIRKPERLVVGVGVLPLFSKCSGEN